MKELQWLTKDYTPIIGKKIIMYGDGGVSQAIWHMGDKFHPTTERWTYAPLTGKDALLEEADELLVRIFNYHRDFSYLNDIPRVGILGATVEFLNKIKKEFGK